MSQPVKSALPRSVYAGRLAEFAGLALADEGVFGLAGRWGEHFRGNIGAGFDGRIIVEIGCFDAGYLAEIAREHPGSAFVGIDWKCKAIYDGAARIAQMGLGNVMLLRARAQEIARIFGAGEVDEMWVFHPDPCDRANERKNRLIRSRFLEDAGVVLRGEGSGVFLKTDHRGYYAEALGVESRGMRVVSQSADYWNDRDVLAGASRRHFAGRQTLFEKRFVRKGKPIYYVEWGKATPR